MDLLSYQKHIADLLGSSSLVDPSQDHITVANYLSDLGLITTQIRYYVICSRVEDHLDWLNVTHPNCTNEIFIASDFDEACDDLICGDCARYILPNTYQKQRFHLFSIRLNIEKVTDWFENQLNDSGLVWQKVGSGVYYVIHQGNIVSFIILDFCTDAIFLTVDKLKVHPTVIITLGRNVPLALFVVPMVELFCQLKTFTEIFQEAVKRGVPEVIQNASLQVLPTSYVPLKRVEQTMTKKLLELQVIESAVYINNVEVISKKAASCFNVFRVLFRQFLQDCGDALPPEKHTLLNINQLEERLGLSLETDLEHQIRKPLNTIQRTIKATLAEKLGLTIERNDVIQTLGWPGSSRRDYGYRINPFTLTLKK